MSKKISPEKERTPKHMEDKTKIIGRLLEKGHISGEEAVVLLTKEIQYVYAPNYNPWYPYPYYWSSGNIYASSPDDPKVTVTYGTYPSTASN